MSNIIQKVECIMSKFLEDSLAAIATIVAGDPDDKETKDAVAALQTKLASDEADAAEVKQVVQALVNQLAAAPANPDAPEVSTEPAAGTAA